MSHEIIREAIVVIAALRRESEQHNKEIAATLNAEVKRSGQAIGAAASDAAYTAQRELTDVIDKARKATSDFEKATTNFRQQRARLYTGLGIVAALSLLSLVATYQGLYGYYHERYAKLVRQVNFLDAVYQADIAPCGNDGNRLCARIDGKAPRYGKNNEYRMVTLKK